MKAYQDHDPVLDKGKAVPHPKRRTMHSYRGSRLGVPVTVERAQIEMYRESKRRKKASGLNIKHSTVAEMVKACFRLLTRGKRESRAS